MLFTTTALPIDAELESVLGVVHAYESIGTGMLSEMTAGVADLFGARGGYEGKVEVATRYALESLELEAASRGANAVIGLSIDHEVVSTRNMVTVSAVGTAVRVRWRREAPLSYLSGEQMTREVRRLTLLRAAQAGTLQLSDQTLMVMRWIRAVELLPYVVWAIGAPQRVGVSPALSLPAQPGPVTAYLQSLPPLLVSEHLHAAISAAPVDRVRPLVEMVHFLQLVDLSRCAAMLASETLEQRKRALAILLGDARVYSAADVATLNSLIVSISTAFPVRSALTTSSSGPARWTCPCGQGNDSEYCGSCGLDIQGFREFEPRPQVVAQLLRDRSTVLRVRLAGALGHAAVWPSAPPPSPPMPSAEMPSAPPPSPPMPSVEMPSAPPPAGDGSDRG